MQTLNNALTGDALATYCSTRVDKKQRRDDDGMTMTGATGTISARKRGNLDGRESDNSSIRNSNVEHKNQQQSTQLSAMTCLPTTGDIRKRQKSNGRTARRHHQE